MFEQAEPRCLTRRLSVSRCTGLVPRLEFKNKRHYHHLLLPEESSHHFNQPFSISLSIHPFTQLPITPSHHHQQTPKCVSPSPPFSPWPCVSSSPTPSSLPTAPPSRQDRDAAPALPASAARSTGTAELALSTVSPPVLQVHTKPRTSQRGTHVRDASGRKQNVKKMKLTSASRRCRNHSRSAPCPSAYRHQRWRCRREVSLRGGALLLAIWVLWNGVAVL